MSKDDRNKPVNKGMLDEAVKAILEGMDRLFGGLKTEMSAEFEKIKADITFIKRDINDIKADLSDTPSRREFNELKSKVDKHYPVA